MRLAVNQNGDRMDDPATVHEVNVLTVVASESYKDFVSGLQRDISAGLSARPLKADEAYFLGKVLKTEFSGETKVSPVMAKAIYRYLVKNDYTDNSDRITPVYHDAKREGSLAPLPAELAEWSPQIFRLIDAVFSEAQLPVIEDGSKVRTNPLNANFHKKEFQDLWSRINRKAAYTVHFDSAELISKSIAVLDRELQVTPLQYTVHRGEQLSEASLEAFEAGEAFALQQSKTEKLSVSVHSQVAYDLIGKLSAATQLTRRSIGSILQGIRPAVFSQFRANPEDFIRKAGLLIQEQKATVIVEHLSYNAVDHSHQVDIFTQEKSKGDFSKAYRAERHVCDYVLTDSENERRFVAELDKGTEVEVYAKLPRGFHIPTPVGNYNPDWAIAFKQGSVKHVYFVAETKGSLSSMELRKVEESKIECARRFFAKITSEQVKYGVVDSFERLMEIVR